ncbi:MAG TPA: hypothetical protein VGM88_09300 [Kofleriaceae bacterium]|jgi:hypothetical protein
MPFALLLRDISTTLTAGGIALDPWSRLVAMEEQLLDRARSAFLVHWFGKGLPTSSLALKIHIANLAELQAKYLEIQAGQRPESWGMNLVTPLLGTLGAAAGAMLGTALNPVILLVGGVWFGLQPSDKPLLQKIEEILVAIGRALWTLIGRILGIPFAIAAGTQHGGKGAVEGSDVVHGVPTRGLDLLLDGYMWIGAATRLLDAAEVFLDQLFGDRKGIKNPLLRAILTIGDKFAAVTAQLIGFAAIVIDRIAPLILPLVDQGIAFIKLLGSAFELVGFLVDDTQRTAAGAWGSFRGVIKGVLGNVMNLFGDTMLDLGMLFTFVKTTLMANAKAGIDAMTAALTARFSLVKAHVTENPVMQAIAMFGPRIAEAKVAFKAIWATYSAKPSGFVSKTLKKAAGTVIDAAVDAYHAYRSVFPSKGPTLPDWPGAPDPDKIRDFVGRPKWQIGDLAWTDQIVKRQADGADPLLPAWGDKGLPSPATLEAQIASSLGIGKLSYAAEESAALLDREAKRDNRGKVLADLHKQDLAFRDYFTVILGRLLPAEARAHMKDLLGAWKALDEKVYGLPASKSESDKFPVLDVPDDGTLYPKVGKLLFRAPENIDMDLVRSFEEKLVDRLRAQTYPAPGAT